MPFRGIEVPNVINVGSFIAQSSGAVSIVSSVITVSQAYNVVSAEAGVAGTIDNIRLGDQAGTDTTGYLPRITLRAASGHSIQVTHSSGTINFNSGQNFHLSGEKTLDLVRTPTNRWSTTEGIQTGSGDIVTTSGTQTLSNKAITDPVLTGTLDFDGNVFAFTDTDYYSRQVGTRTWGATAVTVGSIPLADSRVMTVHGFAQAIELSGTEFSGQRFTTWVGRPTGGSIILVGSEVPVIAKTISAGTPTLTVVPNTLTNNADLTLSGVAGGTLDWVVTFSYFSNGFRA
jgi:hypothetical protein